ncbi:MAG: peroxiredoxin family protein [Deltaproteobacteria bacterium]|nr:peroxiredoxin family protein [Deltaproteobacteria bacterium]
MKQLAQLRERMDDIKARGFEVVVVVAQARDAVRAWLEKNPHPFPILSDETRETIKAYGVYHALGFDAFRIARPAVVLVAKSGEVRFRAVASTQFGWLRGDALVAEMGRV